MPTEEQSRKFVGDLVRYVDQLKQEKEGIEKLAKQRGALPKKAGEAEDAYQKRATEAEAEFILREKIQRLNGVYKAILAVQVKNKDIKESQVKELMGLAIQEAQFLTDKEKDQIDSKKALIHTSRDPIQFKYNRKPDMSDPLAMAFSAEMKKGIQKGLAGQKKYGEAIRAAKGETATADVLKNALKTYKDGLDTKKDKPLLGSDQKHKFEIAGKAEKIIPEILAAHSESDLTKLADRIQAMIVENKGATGKLPFHGEKGHKEGKLHDHLVEVQKLVFVKLEQMQPNAKAIYELTKYMKEIEKDKNKKGGALSSDMEGKYNLASSVCKALKAGETIDINAVIAKNDKLTVGKSKRLGPILEGIKANAKKAPPTIHRGTKG